MKSIITDKLGIDTAIFGFTTSPEIVAEICRSGGMGVLGTVRKTPEQLDEDLAWLTEHCDRPFGVDIVYPMVEAAPDASAAREILPPEHVAFVAELKERLHIPDPIDPDREDLYAGRQLTFQHARELTAIAMKYNTAFLVSALGVPPQEVIDEMHRRGGLVGALVGTPAQAKVQAAAGVDVVIATGTEAGGHTGAISTMVLIPQVVDAVPGTMVLAGGGIGDGRQIAACEILGAVGVWTGSIWMTAKEALTPEGVKQRLLDASSSDTVVTRAYSGRPVRLLNSPWFDAWNEPGAPKPLKAPLQGTLVHETMIALAEHGTPGLATSPIGQIVGVMNEEEPTAAIMNRLQAQYRAAKQS